MVYFQDIGIEDQRLQEHRYRLQGHRDHTNLSPGADSDKDFPPRHYGADAAAIDFVDTVLGGGRVSGQRRRGSVVLIGRSAQRRVGMHGSRAWLKTLFARDNY